MKQQNSPSPWLDAAEKIEAWMGDPHLSPDYLRFRINLARAYDEAQTALEAAPNGKPAGAGRLTAGDVNFAPEVLERLFTAMVPVREKRAGQGEAMARIIERAGKDPGLLPRLARLSVFASDGTELKSLADRLDLGVMELVLLGRMLAAPFVVHAVRRRPASGTGILPVDGHGGTGILPVSSSSDHALEGHATSCPVCGSAPMLARLRGEDGKRRLVCSLCLTEWNFPRVMCPACQSTQGDGLTIISLPESEARWIEVCDRCKRYIKTIDERKLPAGVLAPFVEESITLPLDLLAEREGYLR